MKTRAAAVAVLASAALLFGGSAQAATTYGFGNYSGTNYDFIDMNETVQTADDESAPLFEAPTGSGDQLIFTPSSFLADSSNGEGLDTTHSTFNTTIMSSGAAFIDILRIEEGGDIILSDFPPGSGTAATGVIATLSGTVTILDSVNTGDIGQIITFGGAGGDFDTTFTPGPVTNSLFVGLQPAGTISWTGAVEIDIFSLFTGVTKVELQLNNILQANSESGTSSLIQKKAVNGPRVTVIPEPGTLVLVAPGLVGLAIRSRRMKKS